MVIEPGSGGISTSTSSSKKTSETPVREKPVADDNPTPSRSDNVSLSAAGLSIAKVEAELVNTSDVDQDKVARVRAELESGRYLIDANSLAEKLLNDDQQF